MNVATTTAWGLADPLDVVLARIAERTDATVVEIAVGALPVESPLTVLDAFADRFTYIGHHVLPIVPSGNLRPTMDSVPQIVAALRSAGITRYSAHPPNRKRVTKAGFYRWAQDYLEGLAGIGCSFAVETMYVPRMRDEIETSGGYHLATPADVWEFLEWADSIGWERPLLVDAAHLHIGWKGGHWTLDEIQTLLWADVADELHVSSNDGRRDLHTPLNTASPIAAWVADVDFPIVVDEGKRKRNEIR